MGTQCALREIVKTTARASLTPNGPGHLSPRHLIRYNACAHRRRRLQRGKAKVRESTSHFELVADGARSVIEQAPRGGLGDAEHEAPSATDMVHTPRDVESS